MNRKIESIFNNFENLKPIEFNHKGSNLTGKLIGIDIKNIDDINTLKLYIATQEKIYKVSYDKVLSI